MDKKIILFTFLLNFTYFLSAQTVFINEVDHIVPSVQGVEIAGPASTSLTGWSLVFYDENGNPIGTEQLSGVIPNIQNTYGLVWIDVVVNMPSSKGGVALVDAVSAVVQFISYGTQITGTSGIANGLTSELIGQQLQVDQTLQLTGEGNTYDNFGWNLPGTTTPGEVNTGQHFVTTSGFPLPIELLFFKGESVEDIVHLSWATTNERDNNYFEIQHSLDGITFEIIEEISGKGNTEIVNYYEYLHKDLISGGHYYRLNQVDYDGKEYLSELIFLNTNSAEFNEIYIFPNPFAEKLTIHLPKESDGKTVQIQLFNILGQRLITDFENRFGKAILQLDNLETGQYFLVVNIENSIYKKLIVKQ